MQQHQAQERKINLKSDAYKWVYQILLFQVLYIYMTKINYRLHENF